MGKTTLLDVLNQQWRIVLGQALVVRAVLDVDDLLQTLDLGRLIGDGLDVAAGDQAGNRATQLLRSRHGGQ